MKNCKKCIYSGNCYHEKCYTQMQSVCKDYKAHSSLKMIKIDYNIFCFDRVLSLEVAEQDKEKALQIIDASYDEWNNGDSCECCEEFIINQLSNNGIYFKELSN